ncbi:MAG: excinuclease ABC subunit UvrC [Lachnospiraceae bacterium]|nr:excinuclease ABC subunit UvrC [Lachnospiraceae bacterium]
MERFDIAEELKKLPDKPGVYIMHDEDDRIIYVGKAVILKNRVRSYFRESTKKTVKIQQMVSKIRWFEYVVTDSELEALVLENNLIKEHQPKYNTMLKDDKTYPYIKVTVRETFPRIIVTRQIKKDNARYFGPYTSANSVREAVELIRKLYKIRVCNNTKAGPCLYYHIGQCDAPCEGKITKEAYGENVKKALSFLNGNHREVLQFLEEQMQKYSEEMEFEKAAEYRDLLQSVRQIAQKQKITDLNGDDKDVIAVAKDGESVIVQVFFVRDGKILGREHFYMKQTEGEQEEDILGSFISQYYSDCPGIPHELILSAPVNDRELLETWLTKTRGGKVTITVPVKGRKEKLAELAEKNARIVLRQDIEKIEREKKKNELAMTELGNWLGIERVERMEAYDISNISGFDSVGSMVVYEHGKPKKNDYRKFRIKSVKGPNDYASMEEVLTRRFEHGIAEAGEGAASEHGKFVKFPDLILMDGGKGQVHIAESVLNRLGLQIPVCGMVKDDRHRTRGLYYNDTEIPIDTKSEGFKMITRIQDEAHRFAITFHRSLRSKGQVHSLLDDIPQIGKTRRKEIMRHFESIDELKNATVEEILKVPGMNMRSAQCVYDFFHEKK